MKTLEQVQKLASIAYKNIDDAKDNKDKKKRTAYWNYLKQIIEYLEMNPTEQYLKNAREKNMKTIHSLYDHAETFYIKEKEQHNYRKLISKFMSENGASKLKEQVKNIDFILTDV